MEAKQYILAGRHPQEHYRVYYTGRVPGWSVNKCSAYTFDSLEVAQNKADTLNRTQHGESWQWDTEAN